MSAALRAGLAASLLLCPPAATFGAQARLRVASVEDLREGTLEGISVGARGRLARAPSLERLGRDRVPGEAAHVWALATDGAGNVYLGTGPDGRIVRLAAGGSEKVFATVDDPMVTALAFAPGGDLLAGTGPGGKIWRVRPDGTASVWCETGERYVWTLAVGQDGSVFAGTGEEGIVFRVDSSGAASPLFDSEEAHVVRLLREPGGTLLAGGAGRGLVYRIAMDGTAKVLLDDDLPEIHDLVLEPDGALLVGALAAAPLEPRPPALRIRLPEGATGTPEAMAGFDEAPGATLEGVIEGLPPEAAEGGRSTRGHLVRIAPDGVVRELWRSATEAPYGLAADGGGGALFGTGEPARLYRVDASGDIALLATLREGQITAILRTGGSPVVATSNPAGVYRLGTAAAPRGTFTSTVQDAGGIARWGLLRWDQAVGSSGIGVTTRTGNSELPDATWSAWAPAKTVGSTARIDSPEGRFLQWKLTLGGEGAAPAASGLSLTFAPRNRPPTLREFRLDAPGSHSVSKEAAFRWAVGDLDGDAFDLQAQFRPLGSDAWQSGARADAADTGPAGGTDAEGMRRDGRLLWDTSAVAEGAYEVRGLVSDQPGNPDGRGEEAASEPVVVQVDRTPPRISVHREADGSWRVDVHDEGSAAGRVEVLEGGRVLFAAAPEDGVADSAEESYRLSALRGAEGRRLRALDAAGNAAERPLAEP